MASHSKWWLSGEGQKLYTGPAMPFEIPRGYTSPFAEGERSLTELWQGQKKFLSRYHQKRKTGSFTEAREENYEKNSTEEVVL